MPQYPKRPAKVITPNSGCHTEDTGDSPDEDLIEEVIGHLENIDAGITELHVMLEAMCEKLSIEIPKRNT